MKTRKITPFFSSTFSALTVCDIHFLFENSLNLFSCGPSFGSFWSVKYLNFEQKLPIRTAHNTFLESRQSEITKNLYYALPPEWSPKKVSTHGLLLFSATFTIKFGLAFALTQESTLS